MSWLQTLPSVLLVNDGKQLPTFLRSSGAGMWPTGCLSTPLSALAETQKPPGAGPGLCDSWSNPARSGHGTLSPTALHSMPVLAVPAVPARIGGWESCYCETWRWSFCSPTLSSGRQRSTRKHARRPGRRLCSCWRGWRWARAEGAKAKLSLPDSRSSS